MEAVFLHASICRNCQPSQIINLGSDGFQVVFVLLTGSANQHILAFGRSLSVYTYHIMLYLTFCTETLPFPFTEWNLTADLNLPEK